MRILTGIAVLFAVMLLTPPKSTNIGYTDTALIHNPLDYNTTELFIRTDTSSAWLFNRADSTWDRIAIVGQSGDTIHFANTNLTFTDNRSHNATGYNFSISNIGELYLESTSGLLNAIPGDGTYITDDNNIDILADVRLLLTSTATNDTHAIYLNSASFMKLEADSTMTFIDVSGQYTLSELAELGAGIDTAKVVQNNGQTLDLDGQHFNFRDSSGFTYNAIRIYDTHFGNNYLLIAQHQNSYARLDGSTGNLITPDEFGVGYNNMSNFPNKPFQVVSGFSDDMVHFESLVDTALINFLDSNTTDDQQVGVGAVADSLLLRHKGQDISGNNIALIYRGPTGSEPSSPQDGDLYFDTTTNKLRTWDGSAWQNLH